MLTKSLTIIFLALGGFVYSQNWTGNVNSDWNNASNWSSWPLNNQDIVINPALYTGNAASPIISSNSTFSPAAVDLLNGADLIINANLTTQDDVNAIGIGTSITVNAGIFNVNPGNGGRLIIDLGATMLQTNGTVIVDERFIAGEDAVITINNGNASSGERLLMDLGGQFIQNGGTVSVAQTFAMADGNINGPSKYTLNGGSLSITGEMGFENEAGNFEPTFILNGGTLTVNGTMFWFGAAPGSGTPRFISTGGTVSVNGIIENMLGSTVNMYMSIGGNSTFNYSGNLIQSINVSDSILQHGASSLVFTGTNSILNAGVFEANNNVITTFNGTTTIGGTGSYNLATILIEPNKSLTLNQHLSLKNDFIKNGSFNAQTFNTSFVGTSLQQINGTGFTNFYDLSINNTSDVVLQQAIKVNHLLNLTLGKITSSTTNSIELVDNATTNGGNNLSFVNGPLKKTGNDAFFFPIGKNNLFAGLTITAPSTVASQYTAEYFDQAYSSLTPVVSPLSAVSPTGYWNLTKTLPSDQVQVELHWSDASQSGVSNCAALSVAHWDLSSWTSLLSTSAGSCVGNASGSVQTNQSTANSGIFTLGFYGNVSVQSFDVCFGDSVDVNGTYYSNALTLVDVYTAANGDDSTVISHVVVLPQNITNQSIQLCAGDSLIVGTSVYFLTGSYSDTLLAANGCDSLVQTLLFVGDVFNTSVTSNLTGSTYTLSANQLGTTYQWINCLTGSAINGANSQTFSPTENGSYACVLFDGLCSDTTECIAIIDLGTEQLLFESVQLFPNPSENSFTINFHQEGTIDLSIYNSQGQEVMNNPSYSGGELVKHSFVPGIYTVHIQTANGFSRLKLLVL
jgi:hypothetical protein